MVAAKDYDRDIIKIGRLASAHLCLDDDKVSRIHSVIEVAPDGKLSIIDMGSVEGTFVNGKRVNKGSLTFGDEIRVGNTLIKVEDGASARAAAALAATAAQAPAPSVASAALPRERQRHLRGRGPRRGGPRRSDDGPLRPSPRSHAGPRGCSGRRAHAARSGRRPAGRRAASRRSRVGVAAARCPRTSGAPQGRRTARPRAPLPLGRSDPRRAAAGPEAQGRVQDRQRRRGGLHRRRLSGWVPRPSPSSPPTAPVASPSASPGR